MIAAVQLGSLCPLMLIFSSKDIIGLANSEITNAARIYIKTLLKHQQSAAIRQKAAA